MFFFFLFWFATVFKWILLGRKEKFHLVVLNYFVLFFFSVYFSFFLVEWVGWTRINAKNIFFSFFFLSFTVMLSKESGGNEEKKEQPKSKRKKKDRESNSLKDKSCILSLFFFTSMTKLIFFLEAVRKTGKKKEDWKRKNKQTNKISLSICVFFIFFFFFPFLFLYKSFIICKYIYKRWTNGLADGCEKRRWVSVKAKFGNSFLVKKEVLKFKNILLQQHYRIWFNRYYKFVYFWCIYVFLCLFVCVSI